MTEQIWRAALYLRLSRDDETTGESESIGNQRRLLTEYAREHRFPVIAEYADDGWSGTNFDRPEFQRMMEELDARHINLILVKDLSRLGRDYIQTGRYLELVFPEKGVRCIAVNDGVDTGSEGTDLAPFRNVVNELYARDTSRKIRSALRAKMRDGQFVGNFAPYGYGKDPENKNHLVPDDRAAAVVREIFCWAAMGERPVEIAARLNARGELPPALYRCTMHPNLDPERYSKRKEWTSAGVSRILRDVVYLGHVAQGKTDKISFKSHKTREKKPEEWIIIENCHAPLVTVQVFGQVQRQRAARRCIGTGTFHNLFSGLAFCADCGKAMSAVGTRKKGSAANLACGAYKLYGKRVCTNHFIAYEMLYNCVLRVIRGQAALTPREQTMLFERLWDRLCRESTDETPMRWKSELRRINCMIGQLYEDRAAGKISKINFDPLLARYEQQTAALQKKITGRSTMQDSCCAAQERLRRIIARYVDIQELTSALLFGLIERIEVGQGWHEKDGKYQKIRIYFRFSAKVYEIEASDACFGENSGLQ